jgi:hypothetical protein
VPPGARDAGSCGRTRASPVGPPAAAQSLEVVPLAGVWVAVSCLFIFLSFPFTGIALVFLFELCVVFVMLVLIVFVVLVLVVLVVINGLLLLGIVIIIIVIFIESLVS